MMASPVRYIFDFGVGLDGDPAAVEALYRSAFQNEDLSPLIRALLAAEAGVAMGAARLDAFDGPPVGHVCFTVCWIDTAPHSHFALLGPMAVAPDYQRHGIGRKLVEGGMEWAQLEQVAAVFVLGHPAFYGRFGFRPERSILPPHSLVAEWETAWQSLVANQLALPAGGRLVVPAPWQPRHLWTP